MTKSRLIQAMNTLGTLSAADITAASYAAVAAANAAYIAATHTGGVVKQTKLVVTALPIALSDANVGGGSQLLDFPEGRILILGGVASFSFTTTSTLASTLNASVTCNYGIGTVQTTTQASGTLATTQQDLIPTVNFTSSATINVANTAVNKPLAASAQFDGTTTAVDAYLNVGIALNTDIDGDATITATGTYTVTYILLGDY